jgi:hypothetical protein
MIAELKRIRKDVENGQKLGFVSTCRLLTLLEDMAERIEKLERKTYGESK